MTMDSRNLFGAGCALAMVGLAVWGATLLLNPTIDYERDGTVEVLPAMFDDSLSTVENK